MGHRRPPPYERFLDKAQQIVAFLASLVVARADLFEHTTRVMSEAREELAAVYRTMPGFATHQDFGGRTA